MGAGASTDTPISLEQKRSLADGGLSTTFRRLQMEGLDDKEIYQNLRETYGSLRVSKKLTVSEGSVRSLAMLQLSQTLETNRISTKYDSIAGSKSSTIHGLSHKYTGSSSKHDERLSSRSHASDDEKMSTRSLSCKTAAPTAPKNRMKPKLNIIVSDAADSVLNGSGGTAAQRTPRDMARLSPSGAVHIGGFEINEKGIQSAGDAMGPFHFLTAGRSDFVLVGSLGRGASGSVLEALHIPTLTIVALKMLPIYDADDLHHIASELGVLYQNLAELRLIDSALDEGDEDEENRCEASPQAVAPETVTPKINPVGPGSMSAGCSKKEEDVTNSEVISKCPQVLAMYDAFLDPMSGMVNLVVEYMDGGSLQDVVDNGGCRDEGVLADIAHQVLLGLGFLHKNGQLHRDIKPGNILMNCNGVVKIADFGISKAMDTKNDFNQPNSFVGTMCYMAPERISNDKYSFPGDIWSFGLTLLAVVQGRYPLSPDGSMAVGYWDLVRLICDDDIPELGEDFSSDFNLMMNACLQKDPKDRPTVTMLLQHPFFLRHSEILRGASENDMHGSHGGLLSMESTEDECVLPPGQNSTLRMSTASGGDPLDRTATTRSSQDSGLSRLTMLSRAAQSKAQLPSNPSAVVYGEFEADNGATLEQSGEGVLLTAVRLEHLERVLEKTELKYDQMVATYKQEKLKRRGTESNGGSSRGGYASASGGSFRSLRSSRTFFKSANEPMTPLPNFHTGKKHWKHLARQLRLPLEVVMSTATNIVNEKYFARPYEQT